MELICSACGMNINNPMHKFCLAWKYRNKNDWGLPLLLLGILSWLIGWFYL